MKKALISSETSVLTRATRRNIPGDTILLVQNKFMQNSHFLLAVNSKTVMSVLKPPRKALLRGSFQTRLVRHKKYLPTKEFVRSVLVFIILQLYMQQQAGLKVLARGLEQLVKRIMSLISSVRQ
jgi:hypothetical protein